MIGLTIIQHSKTADTCKTSIISIAKKCKLGNTSDMFVKTDREPTLITAILNIFKTCTLLRCTRHSENNCKDYLKQIGIHGSMKDVMLDVVFGENGLAEAENKFDFWEKMKNSILLLSEMKQQDESGKFAAFIKSRKKYDEVPQGCALTSQKPWTQFCQPKSLLLGIEKRKIFPRYIF